MIFLVCHNRWHAQDVTSIFLVKGLLVLGSAC